VFKNRVVRRIFGPKRKNLPGGWRKLYEELCNLCSLPNIIMVIKLRRMRWFGKDPIYPDFPGTVPVLWIVQIFVLVS
jgi:hypothetical protein